MKKVAIFVENDFQDLEVFYPYYRLKEEGHEVIVVGTGTAQTYFGKYGIAIRVDADAEDIQPNNFDGVIIPGGWAPDHLRIHDSVVDFVKKMASQNKMIAAICHGGWVIASADIIDGKRVTGYRAIRDDLIHAGGLFEDEEVVVDGNLITSRKPDDLPAFCKAILKALG